MALEQTVWLGAALGDTPIDYVAREWRSTVDALVTAEGVVGSNDFKVSQRAGGANQSVDILAGLCVVKGDTATAQGKYVQRNNATVNYTGVPSPPVSGTREHMLYLQINDKQSDTAASGYAPGFGIKLDTGAGIPLSLLPKNALLLAGITRRAGQSSVLAADIRDLRPNARGLDASAYTSKTVPVADRITRRVTTGSDGGFIWRHNLGRKPVGGNATIGKFENVSGSIPTGVVLDFGDAATTSTGVQTYIFGTGAFGLHAGRAVTLSVELW